jgi:hypothetical protein
VSKCILLPKPNFKAPSLNEPLKDTRVNILSVLHIFPQAATEVSAYNFTIADDIEVSYVC